MSQQKQYRLSPEQIQPLATGLGGCIATDRITVDGARVGYMYREEPFNDQDSGWRFFAGDEAQEYLDDVEHMAIYDVNTIANFDPAIIPLLVRPVGSAFEREDGDGELVEVLMLNPDHGEVEGEYRPTPQWSVQLPGPMNQRMDGDDHVLWRLGFTIWLTVWEDPHGLTAEQRLQVFRANVSAEAYDVEEARNGELPRLQYRLIENRPEGVVHFLHGYVFGPVESMNVGIYMDDPAELPLALSILDSARYSRAEQA